MKLRGLYTIVDRGVSPGEDLVRLARDYLQGGARIIQLRDKNRLESPETRAAFRETAKGIAAWKREFDFVFIVNDDLETALEAGADGVHVGKDDPPVEECRRRLGSSRLVGYSSHSLEEAVEAERRGADYVAFGAIFPSLTKDKEYQARLRRAVEGEVPFRQDGTVAGDASPYKVQGIEKLREVVRSLKIPVVAIGGIGRDNIKEILSTGVASVAMISALAKSKNRAGEAKFFSGVFE